MRLCILLFTGLLWLVPGLAQADDATAKVHFEAGRQHYERGDYEQAIAEFEAAYEASPRSALLYNLSLAYERVGRYGDAARSLEGYLEGGSVPADQRAKLEARIENLRKREAKAQEDAEAEAAAAPSPAPDDLADRVEAPAAAHTGFFARLNLGLGYASAETDLYRLHGGTVNGSLAAGYAPWKNLGLHVDIWGTSMPGPTLETTTELGSISLRRDDTRYSTLGLGVGATYWFLPLDLYLAGSLGVAAISAERGGIQAKSEAGFGTHLVVGKQWRLGMAGGNIGLGIAGELSLLVLPESVTPGTGAAQDENVNVFMLGILACLSYG